MDLKKELVFLTSDDNEAKVWDMEELVVSRTWSLEEEEGSILDKIYYESEKNCLLVGFDYLGKVKVYDYDSGKILMKISFEGKRLYQMQYLHNRQMLVVRNDSGLVIKQLKNSQFVDYQTMEVTCGLYSMSIAEEFGWIAVDDGPNVSFLTLDGKKTNSIETFAKSVVCILRVKTLKKVFVGDYFFGPIYVFRYE